MSKKHHLSKNEQTINAEAKTLEHLYEKGTPLTAELNKITPKHFNQLLRIAYKMQDDSVSSKLLPNVYIRDYEAGQPSKLWVESKEQCNKVRAEVYVLKPASGKSLKTKDKHWSLNKEESNILQAELTLGKSAKNELKAAGDGMNKLGQKIWQVRTEILSNLGDTVRATVPSALNPCTQIDRIVKQTRQ